MTRPRALFALYLCFLALSASCQALLGREAESVSTGFLEGLDSDAGDTHVLRLEDRLIANGKADVLGPDASAAIREFGSEVVASVRDPLLSEETVEKAKKAESELAGVLSSKAVEAEHAMTADAVEKMTLAESELLKVLSSNETRAELRSVVDDLITSAADDAAREWKAKLAPLVSQETKVIDRQESRVVWVVVALGSVVVLLIAAVLYLLRLHVRLERKVDATPMK